MKCSLEDCLPAAGVAAGAATRTRSPSFKKPAPRTATEAPASRPDSTSTRSAARALAVAGQEAGLDLAHLHALVAAHHKHVREPVAHHQRLLRHGERVAAAQREVAPRKHPGSEVRIGGQIHVDQRIARLRVHRGRDHAHGALGHGAACCGDADFGAGLDAPQLGGRDLGAPLQAALAHHAEQLCAGTHHRAHRSGARRDHATVRRHHLGVFEAQLLRVQRGLGRLHAGLGGLLGSGELLDLLLAECARGL